MNFEEAQTPETDEAVDLWGVASVGEDPLIASFTTEPYTSARPHVPFYRFFYYPDVLDLRRSGYELSRFIPIFDALDNAKLSQAFEVRRLLHHQGANPIWNPRHAQETEFAVRSILHRFGVNEVPSLLRRMMGRAFPDESSSDLTTDLINVFFWAALAEIARDYAWRYPVLAEYADYLSFPVRQTGMQAA